MPASDALPSSGDVVQVRQRQYLVENVQAPRSLREEHTLVRLVCLDDDAQSRPLSVLWERELGASIARPAETGLGTPARVDPPRHFAAYLHALKWSSVTATDARLFQAPFRAGIQLFDHQLVPLKKALELPRVNLFIADDVGLGKTIEAGLVMQELALRQRAELMLVVCPASVTLQWRDEMEKRFGLRFEVYSRNFVARRRQERGFAVNPWTTHNRFIVSYETLRRTDNYEPLKAYLEARGRQRSLLVLDEAHLVAPASCSRYAVDTERTRAVRSLTDLVEHRLFLSATPHNGHSNSFSALLEMLDPQRFARGTRVREAQLKPVMVRRLKADLKAIGTTQHFPDRKVQAITLRHDGKGWNAQWPGAPAITLGAGAPVELQLARLLSEYRDLVEPGKGRNKLVFINLQKRLLSSIEAFYRTLSVHAAATGLGELSPDARDRDDEELPEEYGESDSQLEAELEEAIAEASAGLGDPDLRARGLLEQMLALGRKHRGTPDAKLSALMAWVREHQCNLAPGAEWSDRRLIVFTEYGDTLRYLKEHLGAAFEQTDRGDERILTLRGGIGDEARAQVQRAFNGSLEEFPVRVLLATDAAREGINLQGHCADLFHFDVPWNPSRLEQRNGRIDRVLQPAKEVRCSYFVYADREEDAVLDTLARKVETIQRELGSLGSVLMERMEAALAGGIRKGTREALERAAEAESADTVRAELETQRQLATLRQEREEVGQIRAASQQVMNFDATLLRDAIDVGFELAGAARLSPVPVKDHQATLAGWKLPALPASWARTLDSIRPPREKDEAPWDWREREVLPVVFEAPEHIDSPVAQLHLSHPVVQRVLQRFLAQGFSASDLSRVTIVRSKRDAVARVLVFGRLSLFGNNAARLHDEVISVAARWVEGGGKGHLKPFGEEADRRAIEQLEATLAEAPELSTVPEELQRTLLKTAGQDFARMWPAVAEESARRQKDAAAKLQQRGKEEANALRQILQSQRESIEEALGLQLELELSEDKPAEKEQLDQFRRDRAYLKLRLAALEKELLTQPDELSRFYELRLPRLVPVGMVYLWPSTR